MVSDPIKFHSFNPQVLNTRDKYHRELESIYGKQKPLSFYKYQTEKERFHHTAYINNNLEKNKKNSLFMDSCELDDPISFLNNKCLNVEPQGDINFRVQEKMKTNIINLKKNVGIRHIPNKSSMDTIESKNDTYVIDNSLKGIISTKKVNFIRKQYYFDKNIGKMKKSRNSINLNKNDKNSTYENHHHNNNNQKHKINNENFNIDTNIDGTKKTFFKTMMKFSLKLKNSEVQNKDQKTSNILPTFNNSTNNLEKIKGETMNNLKRKLQMKKIKSDNKNIINPGINDLKAKEIINSIVPSEDNLDIIAINPLVFDLYKGKNDNDFYNDKLFDKIKVYIESTKEEKLERKKITFRDILKRNKIKRNVDNPSKYFENLKSNNDEIENKEEDYKIIINNKVFDKRNYEEVSTEVLKLCNIIKKHK